jgi:DNA polymerase-1
MNDIIGFDTETESVDFKSTLSRLRAQIIGVSASWNGRDAIYDTNPRRWRQMLTEANSERLRTIWHNYKFDSQALRNKKLPQPKLWEDTAIAGVLLNENRINKLKPLAKALLGVEEPLVFEEAVKQKTLDPEIFAEYARNDARYTYRLWEKFEPQLEAEGLMPVYKLEKQMVPTSLEIERNGIMLDAKKAAKLAGIVDKEIERTKWEIYKKAGRQFNINSNPQLTDVLYHHLRLPELKYSKKTGKPSADNETLSDLKDEHEIIPLIMSLRKIDKLSSSFLNALPKFLDENSRIHSTLNSIGARTGRTSSSNPNLQNIPAKSELGKKLRGMFIAAPGNMFAILDYSQMELRILSEYVFMKTGDRKMFDILASGADLHIATAESMFKKTVGKDDVERKAAKWINFGIVYGITAIGLQRRLKAEGLNLTIQECDEFIRLYMATYPGVAEYIEMVNNLTARRGYIRNLYGRKRRVRGWNQREKRQAPNFTIQGTAADVIKTAMVNLYSEYVDTEVKVVGMIHDELIIEAPKKLIKNVLDLAKETMTITPPGFRLALPVDGAIGTSWADKK